MERKRMLKSVVAAILLAACATGGPNIVRDYETIPIPSKPVHIAKKIVNNLHYLYSHITVEMPVCLMGYEEADAYFVEELQMPIYISGDSMSSVFNPEGCHEGLYLGLVHNHMTVPIGVCGMSRTDFERFTVDDKAKLELIVCATYADGGIGTFIATKDGMGR